MLMLQHWRLGNRLQKQITCCVCEVKALLVRSEFLPMGSDTKRLDRDRKRFEIPC